MEKIKLLKGRAELTNDNVLEGMNFKKIVSMSSHLRVRHRKSMITKVIGLSIVGLVLLIVFLNEDPVARDRDKVIVNNNVAGENGGTLSSARSENPVLIPASESEKVDEKSPKVVFPETHLSEHTAEVDTGIEKEREAVLEGKAKGDGEPIFNQVSVEGIRTIKGDLDIKEIDRSLVKISDKVYASKYEVTNKLYMTFLNYLKEHGQSELLSTAKIDTAIWKDSLTFNPAYAFYYHIHSAYQQFPVVNISHDGAVKFCEWLTAQYNSGTKKRFEKVVFRLPSEEEWMLAASGGDTSAVYPWRGNDVISSKGQVMANYRKAGGKDASGGSKISGDVTAPVESYSKNKSGLYNVSGNVAEMIKEKGVSKGGSWFDDVDQLRIRSERKYDGTPKPYVGFRYFVEVLIK